MRNLPIINIGLLKNKENLCNTEIKALEDKKAWHLKEAENFLNNSSFSMLQHERDARDIEKQIKTLRGE